MSVVRTGAAAAKDVVEAAVSAKRMAANSFFIWIFSFHAGTLQEAGETVGGKPVCTQHSAVHLNRAGQGSHILKQEAGVFEYGQKPQVDGGNEA